MMPTQAEDASIIAVDWSGAVRPEGKMWLAEVNDGALTQLEGGWTRERLVVYLIERAEADPRFIVGIDFAFSMPLPFLASREVEAVRQLWQIVKAEGETWLAGCEPPFWGRPGKRRPSSADASWEFRETELEVPRVAGIRPKSVFQIGGPGAVGTGSVRGMPHLMTLQEAGFSIWPFDPAGWPTVLEIYPRLYTQGLVKTSRAARVAYLADYAWNEELLAKAIDSDDALDAGVSAVVMAQHGRDLLALDQIAAGAAALEGVIWHPGWQACLVGDSLARVGIIP